MKNSIIILLFLISNFINAQSCESWRTKIPDFIYKQYSKDEIVQYMVLMNGKPDLSYAKTINDRTERIHYVYSTLQSIAQRDQKNLIEYLENSKIEYQSFIIVNAIKIKSDMHNMELIAARNDVKLLATDPSIRKIEDIDRNSIEARSPESIEWGVSKINADDMWNLGYDGTGVVIGGQDTGYRWTHQAIKNQYRGWNGSTADHNYNWHDAIHAEDAHSPGTNPCGLNLSAPCDDQGHGTHTMGTMVGSPDIGVAPGAQWIGCRNMESGYGMPSTYLECFEWFLNPTDLSGNSQNPSMAPDVINNSWYCSAEEGCNSGNYGMLETAVENLMSAGIFVVVSAGNSGPNCGTINNPPAFFASSYDVGATDINDDIASFSSRGPTSGYGSSILKPDISAPGVNVTSATNGSDTSYGSASGTSMAGPHVAGGVAVLLSAFPYLNGNLEGIKSVLNNAAHFISSPQECGGVPGSQSPNNTFGYGRLDLLASYNAVLPIKFLKLEGKSVQKGVEIKFEVQSDNFANLYLQKSYNSIIWSDLVRIDWKGNYLDSNPFNGVNYYRLKSLDKDGLSDYSKIISINANSDNQILIYPTLVRNDENISCKFNNLGTYKIEIYDITGNKLISKEVNISDKAQIETVDLGSLETGIYIAKMISDSNSNNFSTKIIKI